MNELCRKLRRKDEVVGEAQSLALIVPVNRIYADLCLTFL